MCRDGPPFPWPTCEAGTHLTVSPSCLQIVLSRIRHQDVVFPCKTGQGAGQPCMSQGEKRLSLGETRRICMSCEAWRVD